jgi:hypothetical protein
MDATKLNPNMFSPWRSYPPPQPQTNYDAMISRALDGKIRTLSPRGLADILWGCAVTSRGNSKLFEELCGQAQKKIQLFSPRDIANFSWGLVQVKFQCWPLQLKFVKLCMSRLGEFDGESLVLTFWSLVQITELQDKLEKPVRAARYTLCQHIPALSAPSCKRLWEILATLNQYDFDLCKLLDAQTGEWGYLMTPNELGEVLRAGSDLKYRMHCLPTLIQLSFKHMEVIGWNQEQSKRKKQENVQEEEEEMVGGEGESSNGTENTTTTTTTITTTTTTTKEDDSTTPATTMNPKMLTMFVLDVLRCIYCFGSWIEQQDNAMRNDQEKTNQNNMSAVMEENKQSESVAQHNESKGTEEKDNRQLDENGERNSQLPPLSSSTPILNDAALNVLSSIMPQVLNNASTSQTMEMLMALTAARAYRSGGGGGSDRTSKHKNKETSPERSLMYKTAWNKLGNGKALNDGQIVQLCAIYDVSASAAIVCGCGCVVLLWLWCVVFLVVVVVVVVVVWCLLLFALLFALFALLFALFALIFDSTVAFF